MAADVSDVLVMVEVGLVNLLEVVEAGKLLLGFGVSGKLVILDTSWVLTEWVLVHVSLLGLCVLVKTVLMGTVPVLTEVGASVMMLVGSVSRTEVEVSACVGNTVVILVGPGGVVAITVVEVKTVSGMVGVDGTVLLGSISIHGVVGEVGTIVTDIDSGHGVVEETVTMGVVSVEEVIREDVIGEVLVVLDETEVGKVVTEEEPGLSVLEELMEVGSIELIPVEEEEDDIDTVDIEEEMIVLKEVVIALVDVPTTGNEDVGETLEVLYGVVRIDVVAMLVDTVLTIWEVDRVGKLAVIEVAGVDMSVEVVIMVVAVVSALVADVGVDVMVAVGSEVIKVDSGVVSVVEVAAVCGVETEVGLGSPLVVVVTVLVVTGVELVNVGELTVSVGVTEDVTGGVGVVRVTWDSVEVSLVPVVLQVDVA